MRYLTVFIFLFCTVAPATSFADDDKWWCVTAPNYRPSCESSKIACEKLGKTCQKAQHAYCVFRVLLASDGESVRRDYCYALLESCERRRDEMSYANSLTKFPMHISECEVYERPSSVNRPPK